MIIEWVIICTRFISILEKQGDDSISTVKIDHKRMVWTHSNSLRHFVKTPSQARRLLRQHKTCATDGEIAAITAKMRTTLLA